VPSLTHWELGITERRKAGALRPTADMTACVFDTVSLIGFRCRRRRRCGLRSRPVRLRMCPGSGASPTR
jgi:hypothetical protein